MRYFKTLGLAALATAALAAFVGTASATELTCSSNKVMCSASTSLHAEAEATLTFHPPIGDINCTRSTFAATTSNTGSASETVTASVSAFTFTGCNATVKVTDTGSFSIHTRTESANNNGTLTSSGLTITFVFAGFHCSYATLNTDIGTITGSTTTSSTATLDIEATIPFDGGESGAFCGKSAAWTGSYKFTSPDFLNID